MQNKSSIFSPLKFTALRIARASSSRSSSKFPAEIQNLKLLFYLCVAVCDSSYIPLSNGSTSHAQFA
jgi:hypothetical protein